MAFLRAYLNKILLDPPREKGIRLVGWLTLARAANFKRRDNVYYLLPQKRGKGLVNDALVANQLILHSGGRISVRGQSYLFQYGFRT